MIKENGMADTFRKFSEIVAEYMDDDRVAGLKLRTQLGNEFIVCPNVGSGWMGECSLAKTWGIEIGKIIPLDPGTMVSVVLE